MSEYRDILGYGGKYKINEGGEIISYRRTIPVILKPREVKTIKRGGCVYYAVVLYDGSNNTRKKYIHRLVCEAFLPTYNPKLQVNHKDGNTANNHLSNLEMVTQSENHLHSYQKRRKYSKYPGVTLIQNKYWIAQTTIDGENVRIGATFKNEYDAAVAYYEFQKNRGIVSKYIKHPDDYPE